MLVFVFSGNVACYFLSAIWLTISYLLLVTFCILIVCTFGYNKRFYELIASVNMITFLKVDAI